MIWIVISIAAILEAITIYIIWNLLKKVETLEDNVQELVKGVEDYESFFTDLKSRMNESYSRIKQIDRIGSFESDDETGVIFKELKDTITKLNERF
ncbi:MAG: hypothetical protein EBU96_12575 [Actinobacteria bacterium]|jgi:hypothetical protein|nr:hypothetical protein [Actinomycetota bacterium]